MQHLAEAERCAAPAEDVSKWDALRALSTARKLYGLSDRDLGVLQALLSFHPDTNLKPGSASLVVHPSNRAICERLNGMPCSTMRRHLARLVAAGVLQRRDSPNGKRYARQHGGAQVAYGFDLRPLLNRFAEFREAAAEIQAADVARRRLRETVSLMRRDLAALVTFGAEMHPELGLWDRLSDLATLTARDLRRKLDLDALRNLVAVLRDALDEAGNVLEPEGTEAETAETSNPSTSESRNEHHLQSSDKDSFELGTGQEVASPLDTEVPDQVERPEAARKKRPVENIPLKLVLHACREIQTFLQEPVRHWQDLVRAAHLVSPMMGISRSAWDRAVAVMGAEGAAVTVAAMLERVSDIRSPGGYLRRLTEMASEGRFSCGPMISALRHRTGRAAA